MKLGTTLTLHVNTKNLHGLCIFLISQTWAFKRCTAAYINKALVGVGSDFDRHRHIVLYMHSENVS